MDNFDLSSSFTKFKNIVSTQAAQPKKTSYQQNVAQPIQTDKWYAGSAPTSREIYGRIYQIGQNDPQTAMIIADGFTQAQSDPSSPWYDPYKQPTNSAVATMASYGIDVSRIDDQWFSDNSWMMQYEPSNAKKASKEQKLSYAYGQIADAYDNDKAVQKEFAALQDEINYLANWESKNYSDDEIKDILYGSDGSAFAKKYPTLAKMDASKEIGGNVLKLNTASNYSRENIDTLIWRARNGGGTGNFDIDTVYSVSGNGNSYKEDPTITAKKNWNDTETYSIYETGMTMREEGMYFGVYEFTPEIIDRLRTTIDPNDATAMKMFDNVVKEDAKTAVLEEELALFNEQVEHLISLHPDDPDAVLNGLRADKRFKNLFELDDTIENGSTPINTTRAINYNWKETAKSVNDRCNEYKEKNTRATELAGEIEKELTTEGLDAVTGSAPAPSSAPTQTETPTSPQELLANPDIKEVAPPAIQRGNPGDVGDNMDTSLAKPGDDSMSNVTPYTETAPPAKTPEQMQEDAEQKALDIMADTIDEKGSPMDKSVWQNGRTTKFGETAQNVSAIMVPPEQALKNYERQLNEKAMTEYAGATKTVREYETLMAERDKIKAERDASQKIVEDYERRDALTGGMTFGDEMALDQLNEHDITTIDGVTQSDADFIRAKLQSDDPNEQYVGYRALFDVTGLGERYYASGDLIGGSSGDFNSEWTRQFGMASNAGNMDEFLEAHPKLKAYADAILNGIPEVEEAEQLTDDEYDDWQANEDNVAALTERIGAMDETLASGKEAYDQAKATSDSLHRRYALLGDITGERSSILDGLDAWDYASSNWAAYPFESYSVYQQAIDSGIDADTVLYNAANNVIGTRETLDALRKIKENPSAYGINPTEQELRYVDQQIAVLEKEQMDATFYLVSNTPEFKKGVLEGKQISADGKSNLTRANMIALSGGDISLENLGGEFFAQFFDAPIDAERAEQAYGYVEKCLEDMDEKEKDYYFYLLKDNEKAANAWLKSLVNPQNGMVMHRTNENIQENIQNSSASGAGNALFSELTAFGQNFTGNVISWVNQRRYGGNVDPDGLLFSGSNSAESMRAGVIDYVVGKVGEENREAVEFIMNALNSAGDSTINALVTSGAFKMIGNAMPFLGKFINFAEGGSTAQNFAVKATKDWVHSLSMASFAADKAYRDAITNHASPEQAQKLANATFWAESVTEAITVGNIKEMWSRGLEGEVKGIFTELFKNGMEEAVGEGFAEWWESNADAAIMGVLSEQSKQIEALVASGIPRTQAEQIVQKQTVKNIMVAAASGYLSSAFSSGGSYFTGKYNNNRTNKQLNDMASGDISKLNTALRFTSGTNGAITISSVLRNNRLGSRGPAQTLMNGFNSDAAAVNLLGMTTQPTAIEVTQGVIANAGDQLLEAKDALQYAALTAGNANNVLKGLCDTIQNGGQVTQMDIQNLLDAVAKDNEDDASRAPKDKNFTTFMKNVTDYRVSVRKAQLLATSMKDSANRINESAKSVQNAQAVADDTQNKKADADAHVEAVDANRQEAVAEQLESPKDENNAPVEQVCKELEGAVSEQQQAERVAQQAQEKAEQAKQDHEQLQDEVMSEVSQQAQAEVQQEMAQEAEQASVEQQQQNYDNAVQKMPPHKAFGQTIEIADDNGNMIRVTGIRDKSDTGTYFTTEDGKVVHVTRGLTEDINANEALKNAMNAFDDDNAAPKVKPEIYFPVSMTVNINGQPVEMIGLAGKTEQDGLSDPVLMDKDGNTYKWMDYDFNDISDEVLDFFGENEDKLPNMNGEQKAQQTEQTYSDPNYDDSVNVRNVNTPVGTTRSYIAFPASEYVPSPYGGNYIGIGVDSDGTIQLVNRQGVSNPLQNIMRGDFLQKHPDLAKWITNKVVPALEENPELLGNKAGKEDIAWLKGLVETKEEQTKKTTKKKESKTTKRKPKSDKALVMTKGANGQITVEAKNDTDTPTQKQTKKVKGKLKSPQEIMETFAKNLGIGYYGTNKFGNKSKKVRGYFSPHANAIAVRNSELGNPGTTSHEGGHGLAQMLGMTGTQRMVNKLVELNEQETGEKMDLSAYSQEELYDEAFAEFFRHYLAGDQQARDFAGDAFVDEFERKLRANPKAYKAVQQARTDLQMFYEASADERAAAMIKYERSKERFNFKRLVTDISYLMADSSVAAEDIMNFLREANDGDVEMAENLRAMALLSNHSQKMALNMLTDNLTDADGTIIGPGFGQMMSDVGFKGTEENIHRLERYTLALHALDRAKQNKPVFAEVNLSKADCERIIRETPQMIKDAEEVWQKFRHNFLQAWMVDTGYMSQELLDQLEETYKHYVPTFRVGGVSSMQGVGGKSGKGYTMREATGGSQDIYSPFYSFIGMVDQITTMVNNNRIAQTFDNIYNKYEGLGLWARRVPGPATINDKAIIQEQLTKLLEDNVDEDIMEQVLQITSSIPNRANNDASQRVLHVRRQDGTTVRYEFSSDGEQLYKLLAGVKDTANIDALAIVGQLTRTMSMLTTGSNPLFAARNMLRDFQTSVNYGSWASNYATGAVKWLRTFAEVWRGRSDAFQQYKALGGGGWTRIDQNNRKSMNAIQSEIFGDDTSTIGKKVKFAGKKLWDTVTLERLNEVIEQTSRFAEYKYGKHDTDTVAGRQEAFLAAQDVTVDFSRSGNSPLANMMKRLIPFFNASMQGVYRTTRQFSEGERDRLPARFAKTVINTALMSALCSGLIMRFGSDEDKEAYSEILSSGIKANHFILPNPFKGKSGAPFIRIPIGQDPLMYAVHAATTNAMWSGSTDEYAIALAATVDVILDNLNPLGSGTIAQPVIDVSHNRTWYGSRIIRSNMEDWTDPASQYNEDTPMMFRWMGRLAGVSPEIVEYLATQYTGFIGSMLIPAMSYDNGELGGLGATLKAVTNKWTADPYSSNDASSRFYDMKADLNTILDMAKQGKPQGLFLRSLTQEQVDNAYAEVEAMMASGGIVATANKAINDGYKKIDDINSNETLSDEDKAALVRQERAKMYKEVEAANQQMEGFYKKYITGETLVDRTFGALLKHNPFDSGRVAHIKTDVEKLGQTFQNDIANRDRGEGKYMDYTLSFYDEVSSMSEAERKSNFGTNRDPKSLLPEPDFKDYDIPEGEVTRYEEAYRDAFRATVEQGTARWETMTPKEKSKVIKDARSAGNAAIKQLYEIEYGSTD